VSKPELERLWQGVESGSQPRCVSDYGVWDMPGNADELASSETPEPTSKFDNVTTGGPWRYGVRNQCRPKIYTHNEEFYYYFLSFRCCAEPDGKPTDPRTARQVRENWPMSKVEHLAQFTIVQMKEKLEQKKAGSCSCAAHDVLCKTMCGSLLGPGAVDATH
jgi:sulfatase modifying factor 1